MRIVNCLALALLLAFGVGPALAAPDMVEGRWEVTTRMEMPGMPMELPAYHFDQCITREDLVPRPDQPGEECRLVDHDVAGDTVTWTVVCETEGGPMTSRGRITYAGEGFQGTVVNSGGQLPGEMTMRMTGKRLGDCR